MLPAWMPHSAHSSVLHNFFSPLRACYESFLWPPHQLHASAIRKGSFQPAQAQTKNRRHHLPDPTWGGSSKVSSPAPHPIPAILLIKGYRLILAEITAVLHTSHSSTHPMSGTFLEPHYLLLCYSQSLDVSSLESSPLLQPYASV